MLKKLMLLFMVTLLSIGTFTGCEIVDDDKDTKSEVKSEVIGNIDNLEIVGSWSYNSSTNNTSTNHTITNQLWITDGTWGFTTTILEYSNKSNYLYSKNEYGYGKTVWTEIQQDENENSIFYQCGIVNSKSSLAEAKADNTEADSTDPENSGCGEFSWTKMTAQ